MGYEIERLVNEVHKLGERQQEEFFEALKTMASGEEIKALRVMVAYFKLMSNAEYRAAMKTAMAQQMYKEFNDERASKKH